MVKYLRKECSDLNEVAFDNSDDKDNDDDDGNSKNYEVFEIGEALTMLDRLVNLKYYQRKKETLLSPLKTN